MSCMGKIEKSKSKRGKSNVFLDFFLQFPLIFTEYIENSLKFSTKIFGEIYAPYIHSDFCTHHSEAQTLFVILVVDGYKFSRDEDTKKKFPWIRILLS